MRNKRNELLDRKEIEEAIYPYILPFALSDKEVKELVEVIANLYTKMMTVSQKKK